MSRRPTLILVPVAAALLLGACSGSTPPTGSPASTTPVATATPSPTSTPATSSPAEVSAAPTALDPCQLVTAAEASALAGTSFGAGKEETTSGGAKICVYGSATGSVVQVLVAQAPDAATAQANWSQEQVLAQTALKKAAPAGVNFTLNLNDASVAGADRAAVASATATIEGVSVAISAIYVLKGATFFTFSDLAVGHASAGTSALEAQAETTIGRVP